MVDMTDDWMRPNRSVSYSLKEPEKGKIEYLIERKKATPVSGNVSAIYRWERYWSYDTAVERDTAIKKLSEEHPMWHLRPRNRDAEYHGIFPPDSHPGINR